MCVSAEEPEQSLSNFNIIQPIEIAPKENDFKIEVDNITDSSADLRWKSETLYISYRICKYNILTNQWDEYLTTTKTELKLTGLASDTSYKLCIMSGTSDEIIAITEFTTAIKKAQLRVDDRSSNQAVLSFRKPDENETVVIYRRTRGRFFKKIAEINDASSYTDTGLKPETTYFYKAKTVVQKRNKKVESKFGSTVEVKTLLSMGLPSGVSGKTKTYAYYTAVTARGTEQYKLLNSEECYTDEETGIRMYDGCYCVALGSFYGTKIGTKYKITFSSGNAINAVLCDQKANRHTDSKHQYAVKNKDIVEFYVEKSKLPSGICGDYGRLEQFSGSIKSIEKYVD